MNYRLHILTASAAANGHLSVDVEVQRETSSGVWELSPNGKRSFLLDGKKTKLITEGAGTDVQKRAAVVATIKDFVTSWGIYESIDALDQLEALLPNGWPVNVTL